MGPLLVESFDASLASDRLGVDRHARRDRIPSSLVFGPIGSGSIKPDPLRVHQNLCLYRPVQGGSVVNVGGGRVCEECPVSSQPGGCWTANLAIDRLVLGVECRRREHHLKVQAVGRMNQ